MKFLRVLSVLCVLCGLLVQAYALDREAFAFTNYNLDVRVEPEQQRLAVRGKISLRNDSAAARCTSLLLSPTAFARAPESRHSRAAASRASTDSL